jgi:uncharacterized protein (TIGR02270 family)
VRTKYPRDPVGVVALQHEEDLLTIWRARCESTKAGHVALRHLSRFDERLAAHLDGCALTQQTGRRSMRAPDAGPAEIFGTAAVALELADTELFEHCVTVAEAVQECSPGLNAALGWVELKIVSRVLERCLSTSVPIRRRLYLAACRLQRVDPGAPAFETALTNQDQSVRAAAIRTAGELGIRDLLSACSTMSNEDGEIGFWAAYAGVLLGNRGSLLDRLMHAGLRQAAHQSRAFRVALQAMTVSGAHKALQSLARDPTDVRGLLQGSGIVGDPAYVSWLIGHMSNDHTARLAGEAFSLISGTDLAWLDLERKPPENFESGPNDDADDPNVDMDPDDGLPWPDPEKIKDWWAKNSSRFTPGHRYFMGAPVTRAHCIDVLKNGYQRQRILAAHYLCLLDPGTPLFNTSAPAWRQQKLLAQMA